MKFMRKFVAAGIIIFGVIGIYVFYGSKTRHMTIESPAFKHNQSIPATYTCDGGNINPEFRFDGVPSDTKSLTLIMDDPDIPDFVKQQRGIQVFDHWVVFNIPPDVRTIREGIEPNGVAGLNSAGKTGYTGPCPPDREHRYFFKLYALDTQLSLAPSATKADVEKAMEGHVLAQAELIGLYKR